MQTFAILHKNSQSKLFVYTVAMAHGQGGSQPQLKMP